MNYQNGNNGNLALIPTLQANEDTLRRVRLFASCFPREKAAALGAIVVDNPKPGYYTVLLLEDRQQIRSEVTRILKTNSFVISFYVDEPMVFDIYLREAYPPSADEFRVPDEDLLVLGGGSDNYRASDISGDFDDTERAAMPQTPVEDFTDEAGRIFLTNPAKFAELAQKRPSELAAVEFAQLVLWELIQTGASDVYLQAQTRMGRISFLIDDVKQERWTNLKLPIFMDLCRCLIGAMADRDSSKMRRINIDSSIKIRATVSGVDKDFELRLHSHPEAKGVSLVLRSQSNLIKDFEATGMEKFQIEHLTSATRLPNGLVMLTGTTGSGKTGTLECVYHYYETRKTRHIIEITDTIEVISSGRDQIEIGENYTWDDAVRAALRSKPHIIGFGELRGALETEKAVEAGMTGHLVLGTYHAKTVVITLDRLSQMGVDIQRLAASLNLIQAQVLVNRLCAGCREIDRETSSLWNRVVYRSGGGCEMCRRDVLMEDVEIGYYGCTVVAESFVVTEEIEDMIIRNAPVKEIMNFAVADGQFVPFAVTARMKVWAGITSVKEVERKIGKAFNQFYGLDDWEKGEYFRDKNFTDWLADAKREDEIYSRLIKLRFSARLGKGGEQESAKKRLDEHLTKFNLTEADIDDYETKIKNRADHKVGAF